MDPTKIVAIVLQLVSLAPNVIPLIQKAIEGLKDAFDQNGEVTQADIDALVANVQAQSEEIQKL